MDKATYNGSMIYLKTLPREQFQVIYEASIQGKVTCVSCNRLVRLYLGIQKMPHFYHQGNENSRECENYSQSLDLNSTNHQQEMETFSEQNGFRIPKGRSILTIEKDQKESNWRPVAQITNIPSFSKPAPLNMNIDSALDPAQDQAVKYTHGPLLILAGAGSGKTRVLTQRTAYMVKEKHIDPKTIMLVTFTTKAAKEMQDRLGRQGNLSKQQIKSIVSGTFHSIFYKILSFHDPVQWNGSKLIKWDWQREQIIKEAARKLEIDEKDFAFDQALQQISYWKNTLSFYHSIKPKNQWEERVLFMYQFYEEQKKERGLFDFDDMLLGCYDFFSREPDILKQYQQRFRYFLIDEFQDINNVQYEIMKMLSYDTKNLCVVGDDDQSIYAFRGSNPEFILEFEQDFPNAKVVTLSQNYRSTHSIVVSANIVIEKNKLRREKKMNAGFDNGLTPTFFFPYDEEEEATMIVTDLKEQIEHGAKPSDFAILYRTHTASRALFERLSQSSLPFTIDQDSESFYKRRMVKCLLAYLRLSIDPNHTEAISDILSAFFLKQTVMNDLKAISILEDCSLIDALLKLSNIHSFQQKKLQKIVPLFSLLRSKPPTAGIEMIEKQMGFDDFVKKRGNEGNVIEKGSDDIRDLKVVARKFTTIAELLSHVDHMIAMSKEIKQLNKHFVDSIQLLTIHRSKGLEYKKVYILGAVDGSLPHDFALESFRNGDEAPLEEERRLMYVAMTRAQEALFVSVPNTRRGKKAYPSRFISNLIKGKQ